MPLGGVLSSARAPLLFGWWLYNSLIVPGWTQTVGLWLLSLVLPSAFWSDINVYLHAGIPVFFSIGEKKYFSNNSNVTVTRIGPADESSLNCHTDSTACCRGVDNKTSSVGTGEWLFPNGTSIVRRQRVPGDGFYYTRFHQVIRLYRQGDIQFPLGTYCCRLPDSDGVMRTFCANLTGELS